MKIAILTQPLKSNYGGILQAFALQRSIRDLGHDVVTIDRQLNAKSKLRQTLSYLKHLSGGILSGSKPKRFNAKQQSTIFKNTLGFIDQHIKTSAPIDSEKKMLDHFHDNFYDAIVVGSDQTWRPLYSPNIFNFYLDFLGKGETKRIAYACSFGVDEWEYSKSQTETCRELAKKFDAISVREQSGINLCTQYLDVNSELVLDPTLLLSANEYLTQLNICDQKARRHGLFTYILDGTKDKTKIIKKVCGSLNLHAFNNQPAVNLSGHHSKNIDDYVYPEVEGWIKGIHDSEFVITDSFHGCVFSIIFNKPFLVIGNQLRGMARFKSLLNMFGIEDRLIIHANELSNENISNNIDWNRVNNILENQRARSLCFLKTSLDTTNLSRTSNQALRDLCS